MTGATFLKHAVKHAAGLTAVADSWLTRCSGAEVCILMYHRVADTGIVDLSVDGWNITPARLEKQFQWLAENTDCVPLADALRERPSAGNSKPVVALTFDDGFGNFRLNALPLLERYHLPATVFLVTRYVGSEEPYHFDQWGQKHHLRAPPSAWRAITWTEVEACLKSTLVTVGSHSHNHFNAMNLSDAQLKEETALSLESLRKHLGDGAACPYSYPYGSSRLGHVRPAYREAVRAAGYSMAVTTDLGLATSSTPRFQVPRVEVDGYDSPRILRAKVLGSLWPQRLCQRFRQAERYSK